MTRLDDLIDAVQASLEELRIAVHEQIAAAAGHKGAAEEFTHEAQAITKAEDRDDHGGN